MTTNKAINILSAALVLFLAAAAFVLSYDALHELAKDNGIKPGLAWLWPLTLDAVMIAASLAVLRASLNAEGKVYQWGLVGAFTLASIGFNIVHAPATLLARSIFALPPLVVFLGFELLMKQTAATVKRNVAGQSIADLDAELDASRKEAGTLTASIDALEGKRSALKAELAELRTAKKSDGMGNLSDANVKRVADKAQAIDALLDYLAVNPDTTLTAAGEHIGRSRQTVSGYLTELESAGRISRNGQGVEVTRDV